jgi:hypothetical protein
MPCTKSSKNIQHLICSQNLECPQPTYACTRRSKRVTRNTGTFILGTTLQQNLSSTLMKTKSCTELLPCRRVIGGATTCFSSEMKRINQSNSHAVCLFIFDVHSSMTLISYASTRRGKHVTRITNTLKFILGTTPQQNLSSTLMKTKSCTKLLLCRIPSVA